MSLRIEKLKKIKKPAEVNQENDKFYDEIHNDLDSILFELHSTIEHVRISSMITNNSGNDSNSVSYNFDDSNRFHIENIDEKITEVAIICREFVSNSKNMISSTLVDQSAVKPHIRNAMNSISTLVIECFQTCFSFLYRNETKNLTKQGNF
jgi:hypothetical protein